VAGIGDYNAVVGIPGGQRIPGMSAIGFGNSGIDGIGDSGIRHKTDNKTLQISEKLSLSRGRHYLSVGGQWIHYTMGQDYASNSGLLGTFNFNGSGYTGFGFADFLLDQVASKSIGQSSPWTQLQSRIGIFVQDDFKVNSNLTLNLGLRWEYASPIKEENNQQATSTSTRVSASTWATAVSATGSTRPTTGASPRGSALRGLRTTRPSSAAATAWCSIRRAPVPTAACR
jgi:outer membrane receptor protein involved in Fe transport